MDRIDGRKYNELRPFSVTRKYVKHAEGSVLIEMGDTKVICTATISDKVPPFLRGAGSGWVTAEYGMLPRSTGQRMNREAARGKQGGRTLEIQRLIGRALRQSVDLEKLGERTITIDCDVIQADGGTRTASITGSWIALYDAVTTLIDSGQLTENPMLAPVAAISVGVMDDTELLDLCYEEDSSAEIDMNIVMTEDGKLVEIQGTAEKEPYTVERCFSLVKLAASGIEELIEMQKKAVGI